jgi:hypothetical protein
MRLPRCLKLNDTEGGSKAGGKPSVASRQKDTEEKATHLQRMTERNGELERLRRRYAGRGKEGKGRLLGEFCEQHGYERKYAIKPLQGGRSHGTAGPRPGPEPEDEPVPEVAERIWTRAEQLCGKRLARRWRHEPPSTPRFARRKH